MSTKRELFGELPCPSRNASILLLTHIDLDGAVPVVLARSVFSSVDVLYCNNGTMSADILSAVRNPVIHSEGRKGNYDFVIACDISVNENDAAEIDKLPFKENFVLIDHHASAVNLNRYDWAVVEPNLVSDSFRAGYYEGKEGHSAGTSLLYDYLEYNGMTDYIKNKDLAKILVHKTATYDTWDWNNVFGGENGTEKDCFELNTLFMAKGRKDFVASYSERLDKIKDSPELFDEDMLYELKKEKNNIKEFVEDISSYYAEGTMSFKEKFEDGIKVGEPKNIVYVDSAGEKSFQYNTHVFEDMKKKFPDADIYLINYGSGLQLRTSKPEIDISRIAAAMGGGGHKGAGGFKFPYSMMKEYSSLSLVEAVEGTKATIRNNPKIREVSATEKVQEKLEKELPKDSQPKNDVIESKPKQTRRKSIGLEM